MPTRFHPLRLIVLSVSAIALASGLLGPASASAGEMVKYRLPKAKAVHVKDEATAKSYEKSLKRLGVTSKLQGHDGHFDLSMQCPQWREAEFDSHAEADKWQKWLTSLGFETKHSH